jgi:hypothetical protein
MSEQMWAEWLTLRNGILDGAGMGALLLFTIDSGAIGSA